MKLNMFSSKNIKNEATNLTSEHPYYEYNFERKSQTNISPSNKRFEQPE